MPVDRKKFLKALELTGGTITPTDMVEAALQGHVRAWFRNDSVIVGSARHRALVIHVASGDLDDVLDLLKEEVYDWGREQGCERTVFVGRRGWAKVLEHDGWRIVGKPQLMYERSLGRDNT